MYPDAVDSFSEKLNKIDNNTYVIEEEVSLIDGIYEDYLKHDNVDLNSINVYTGTKLTGEKITNFLVSTPSKMPWKKIIKIFANLDKVYVTYETQGDTVEAEDINKLQDSVVNTQIELNRYKKDNNLAVLSLKDRATMLENSKAEKVYVDTELNKRYLKTDVYTKTETDQRIQDVIGTAPEALDTLQEIANSLNNDNDFAGTMINELSKKVDKIAGKKLSTEDFTTAEKAKLGGIESGANKYIHPSTHSASMITEDSTHRFVTDTDKVNWNDANSKKHTHDNLSLLETITQALIDAWNSKADASHTHDERYYTENEANAKFATKEEIGNAGYGDMPKSVYDKNNNGKVDVAEVADTVPWTGVTGKPSSFNPSNHTHTKANITDFPTTLPANGGNADTVDGKHASDFMLKGSITWNSLKGV